MPARRASSRLESGIWLIRSALRNLVQADQGFNAGKSADRVQLGTARQQNDALPGRSDRGLRAAAGDVETELGWIEEDLRALVM